MKTSTVIKKLSTVATVTSLFTLSIGNAAQAITFQKGDVFAAVASGNIQHYDKNLNLLQTLNIGAGGFTTGMAFDAAGNLFATGFSAGTVAKFDNNGTLLGNFATGLATPESVVVDKAGDIYIGTVGSGINKFAPNGTALGNVINTRVDFFDLSADQSTFVYGQEGNVVRTVSNGLPGTPGSDFASGLSQAFAMRFLSDGGLLVADGNNVKRFNAAGTLTQTYDTTGEDSWFALNLDPDGTSFWSGDFNTANFYKIDLATGGILDSKNTGTGTYTLFGLAIFGEITQGGPGTEKVPEPASVLGLITLGALGAGSILKRKL